MGKRKHRRRKEIGVGTPEEKNPRKATVDTLSFQDRIKRKMAAKSPRKRKNTDSTNGKSLILKSDSESSVVQLFSDQSDKYESEGPKTTVTERMLEISASSSSENALGSPAKKPKSELHVFDLSHNGQILVIMSHDQQFSFHGKCQVCVRYGEISMLGYTITESSAWYNMYSPETSSFLTIAGKECTKSSVNDMKAWLKSHLCNEEKWLLADILSKIHEFNTIVILQPLSSSLSDYVSRIHPFQTLFSLKSIDGNQDITIYTPDDNVPRFEETDNYLYVSGLWKDIQEGIADPIVVLCGGKNCGKSTLARYLMNSTLNNCKQVCFLECDVGQTEFTPQGCVALNVVDKPLLGPPFTHQQKPISACFVGGASPVENPTHYIQCVKHVFRKYQTMQMKPPLIVNTMGWTQGLGLQLLVDILRIVDPNLVVQLDSRNVSKNLPPITPVFVKSTPGWMDQEIMEQSMDPLEKNPKLENYSHKLAIIDSPMVLQMKRSRFTAQDHRSLTTLSHLHTFPSLVSEVPCCVPWKSVAVHVCTAVVPRSQILYSLNGGLVALCKVDTTKIITVAPELPRFLEEMPIAEYIGMGLIRGIDPVKKLFYIITPVDTTELQRVNCLMKGAMEMPHELLMKEVNGPSVPYIDVSHDGLAAASVRARRYIPRKKYSKSILDL